MHNEIDPSGRFQLRSRGELQIPGSCIICGSGSNEEGYLDFGIFVDYHGTLYFCMTCLGEAAQVAGFMSPQLYAETNKHIEEKLVENKSLKEEIEDAKRTIDSLKHLLGSSLTASSDVVSESTTEPEVSDEVSLTEQPDAPSPFEGATSGKPKPKKSVKVT